MDRSISSQSKDLDRDLKWADGECVRTAPNYEGKGSVQARER